MAMPESVRLVIGGRVGRLGSDAGKVLAVASVIGRDFDLDLLARATTTSEDDVLDILDAAAAAALVRELNGCRVATTSRTPHPAHALRGFGRHPASRRTDRRQRHWKSCAATNREPEWVSWHATGSPPRSHRPDKGHRLLPARG